MSLSRILRTSFNSTSTAHRSFITSTTALRSMSLPPVQLPGSMNGLTTNPKLHLYTASTPNGYKVSVLLEELLLTYPELAHSTLSYDFRFLSFDAKHQKLPQFLDINPNGRIPALVDDNLVNAEGEGHKVFESASVMLWLVERYDKDYVFWFKDEVERSIAMSWIYFIHGGGSLSLFFCYAL